MPNTILISGSSGLIGSEVCTHFSKRGFTVHGLDNSDLRKMRNHYPEWNITKGLEQTIQEIVDSWKNRAD
jgi:nucleoside-diphosphate-sugar epimerase